MSRLTEFVLRRRRLVGLIWLLALLAGGYASSVLSSHLSQSFEIPGTRSDIADAAIIARYHTGATATPLVPVIRLPAGRQVQQVATRAELTAAFAAAAQVRAAPGTGPSRVVSVASTGSQGFVSADGRTTFGLIFPPASLGNQQLPTAQPAAVRAVMLRYLPSGSQVQVTGLAPLTTAGGSGTGPGVQGEILIGALGALAVLAFVFASLLAVLPLVIAAASVTTAFLAILGLTYLMNVNFVVQFLVGLIGLGVAIDYSLLLITRWREELARGSGNEAAIGRAMDTAGRAIVFSGVTVALGLLALIALPIPFIRSIGLGGMLIPLISVAVTLTLVPAVALAQPPPSAPVVTAPVVVSHVDAVYPASAVPTAQHVDVVLAVTTSVCVLVSTLVCTWVSVTVTSSVWVAVSASVSSWVLATVWVSVLVRVVTSVTVLAVAEV